MFPERKFKYMEYVKLTLNGNDVQILEMKAWQNLIATCIVCISKNITEDAQEMPQSRYTTLKSWHHDFYIAVLSGIKQVNVELEPGFQTNVQKRDNGKCS